MAKASNRVSSVQLSEELKTAPENPSKKPPRWSVFSEGSFSAIVARFHWGNVKNLDGGYLVHVKKINLNHVLLGSAGQILVDLAKSEEASG